MKALDLQIFEKHPDVDAYRFGPSFTPYAIVAVEKRFADAELAATYQQIEKEAWCLVAKQAITRTRDLELEDRMNEMSATVHRFASLPHYDEQ